MKWIKLIAVNLLVFVAILVVAEIILRVSQTISSCFKSDCNASYVSAVTIHKIEKRSPTNAIGRFDEELGQVPKEGFNALVDRWNNAKVTITDEGFRDNENKNIVQPADLWL
jgi:hypothetical protein